MEENNTEYDFDLHTAAADRYAILKDYSIKNRRNATDAEYVLWQYVRATALGVKFRRQHAIADYIVDFVCLKKKLVIEVDGGYHDDSQQKEEDKIRSERLYKMGYYVLRFTNEQVINDTEYVIGKIKNILNNIN